MHDLQIAVLLECRRVSPYSKEEDWVFASPQMQGRQSFWPERLRKNLQADSEAPRDQQESGLAYIPAHFIDDAPRQG